VGKTQRKRVKIMFTLEETAAKIYKGSNEETKFRQTIRNINKTCEKFYDP